MDKRKNIKKIKWENGIRSKKAKAKRKPLRSIIRA